ncbi:MAG: ATP-binding cassette domain-containing protein, partial [Candidatus Omnitrophota bacterium]
MSEKIAFQLSDLHVSYGKKEILHGLNVKMQTGAIGLLGPNGAGKSTLLKTLMGF